MITQRPWRSAGCQLADAQSALACGGGASALEDYRSLLLAVEDAIGQALAELPAPRPEPEPVPEAPAVEKAAGRISQSVHG